MSDNNNTITKKFNSHDIYIYTSFNYRMTISSINTIKESIGQFVLNQLNVEIPTIYIYICVCVALSNAEPDKMLLIKKKKDAVIIIKQSPINASMSCIYIYSSSSSSNLLLLLLCSMIRKHV